MKKLTTRLLLLFSLVLFASSLTHAQEATFNITHGISKSASKVGLYDYYIDNEKNQIELVYKLKESKKDFVLETYLFKLDDLSFISSKKEEIEKEKVRLEKEKAERKDDSPTKLLKIYPNFMNGKLVLKRGHIEFWYAGRAHMSKFVSDDGGTVVTTQEGDKFIYIAHQTESQDLNNGVSVIDKGESANVSAAGTFGLGYMSIGEGNVSIIGMEKTKPYYSKYAFTIYDAKTRSEKLYKSFDLKYSYSPISVKYLPNGDIGMVLWPIQEHLVAKTKDKFNFDPDKNFKYIQINTKGEKVTDVNFKLEMGKKGGQYVLDIIQTDKEGEIILFGLRRPDYHGVGTAVNPKYVAPIFNAEKGIGLYKADGALVIKIVDNKIAFKKETTIDDLMGPIKVTDGSKALKPEELIQGFKSYNAVSDDNGNVLINGIGTLHEVIQIDNSGNIITYMDQPDQDWANMNELIKTSKGSFYWINIDIPKYEPKSADDTQKAISKRTGVISKIDSKKGEIEKTISLTPKGIALDVQVPIKMIDEDHLLILGQGKKKEISLSIIKL